MPDKFVVIQWIRSYSNNPRALLDELKGYSLRSKNLDIRAQTLARPFLLGERRRWKKIDEMLRND